MRQTTEYRICWRDGDDNQRGGSWASNPISALQCALRKYPSSVLQSTEAWLEERVVMRLEFKKSTPMSGVDLVAEVSDRA